MSFNASFARLTKGQISDLPGEGVAEPEALVEELCAQRIGRQRAGDERLVSDKPEFYICHCMKSFALGLRRTQPGAFLFLCG